MLPFVLRRGEVLVTVPVADMARLPADVIVTLFVRLPVSDTLNEPTVSAPLSLKLPLSVTVKAPPIVELVIVVFAVSVSVRFPPVFTEKVPALVLATFTLPVPEVSDNVPVDIELPAAVSVMLPEPLAASATELVPFSEPVTMMLPLF